MKRSASSVLCCGMRNRWEHFEQVICVPANLRSNGQGALQKGHFVCIVFVGWGSTGITSSTSSLGLGGGLAGATGTTSGVPHFGHCVRRPTARSGALSLVPHLEQTREMDMVSPLWRHPEQWARYQGPCAPAFCCPKVRRIVSRTSCVIE